MCKYTINTDTNTRKQPLNSCPLRDHSIMRERVENDKLVTQREFFFLVGRKEKRQLKRLLTELLSDARAGDNWVTLTKGLQNKCKQSLLFIPKSAKNGHKLNLNVSSQSSLSQIVFISLWCMNYESLGQDFFLKCFYSSQDMKKNVQLFFSQKYVFL